MDGPVGPPDEPESWESLPLDGDNLQPHFEAAMSYADELHRIGRSYRRTGMLAWAAAAVMSVAAVGTVAFYTQRKTDPKLWIAVDQSTGWTGSPISSADALTIINDPARKAMVTKLIRACEGFNPQTLDQTDHACALMLSPEQQAAYRQRTAKENPEAPVNVLGPKGQARVEDNALRFWDKPPARPGTWAYEVKFLRTEFPAGGGRPVTRAWNAQVYFSLNPGAVMAPADALENPAGFQAFGYSAHPEGS